MPSKRHHWYTCKNGNPEDIATMEAERGVPKKRIKKGPSCNTELGIVVASGSVMQFPHHDGVEQARAKKSTRNASSSSGAKKSKKSATSTSTRSGTGSNEPLPLQSVFLGTFKENQVHSLTTIQTDPMETMMSQAASPRVKIGVKKNLTPKRLPVPADSHASPASPASNTRSKKKLQL